MALDKAQIRKVHRILAPIVLLPLLVTLVTGSLYQIALLTDNVADYYWLIRIHKGDWLVINLEAIYPFLNALGLLVMLVTGITMWLQMHRPKRQRPHSEA